MRFYYITYKVSFVFLLAFYFAGHNAFAQQSQIDSISGKFEKYQSQNLPEKIYVHSDKDFYLAGELVWFKVYCVDGFYHRPLDISKVAYVEILSATKQPVAQAKIELKEGSGSGSFLLPSFLNSGNYLLRAYTNRMKNYSPEFYFEKLIPIVNSAKSASAPAPADTSLFDMQLMPEGGNLVNDIESRIAFKVVDRFGKGRNGSGAVIDASGDTVARFQSHQFGMGSFVFRPISGKQYKAVYYIDYKQVAESRFPTVYAKGYSMSLSATNNSQRKIAIRSVGIGDRYLFVLVHSRGILKHSQRTTLVNGNAGIDLNIEKLGEGISVITLFDDSGRAVCERLVFKQPAKSISPPIQTDQSSYGLRKKVTMKIGSGLNIGDKGPDLSMSVYLLDSLEQGSPEDIVNYLWLSSDITGTIEDPGYYLRREAGVDEASDILMLTQGWRRFEWSQVFAPVAIAPKHLTEYAGPIIEGNFTRNGQTVGGMETWLSVPGQHYYLAEDSSHQYGNSIYQLPAFYGSNEIVVQSNTKDDNARFFSLANPFSEIYSTTKISPLLVSERWKEALNKRSIAAQVQQSFGDSLYHEFVLPENTDTIPFYGKPDKEYLLDDYTRFVSMEEVLREYVAEVRLRKQGEDFRIAVKNTPYQTFFDNQPLVLIDGVPIGDMNKVLSLDPLKIRKLDVIARKFYMGSKVIDGILSYSSYEGDLGGFVLGQNSIVIDYEGLQLQRKFYSPVYETPEQISTRMPDFRNLLLWAPDLRTSYRKDGRIEFYTSDIAGVYAISVQGISSDGTPISSVHVITVTARN